MPPLVSHAGSWGVGNPALTVVVQERFIREARAWSAWRFGLLGSVSRRSLVVLFFFGSALVSLKPEAW